MFASLLVFLSVLAIGKAFGDGSVQRDTDSTLGASVPTTGIRLSMYRAISLGSCSFTPPIDPNIAPGPTTFPANTAFFVRHAWIFFTDHPYTNQTLGAFERPTTDFELYIDHVEQSSLPDFSSGNGFHLKQFVFNFPNGMTGTHLFQGWWFQDGYLVGGAPNTSVIQTACNLQVTFT